MPHSVHCECKERFLCLTVYIVNANNVFMPHSVHCECKEKVLNAIITVRWQQTQNT